MRTEDNNERPESPMSTENKKLEAQTVNPEPGETVNDGDVEVFNVGAVAEENPNERQRGQTGNNEGQAEGTGNAQGGTVIEELSTLAAARAAAIGISLDTPANEDPAVIQAACDSTGIDPTFFSALPAVMRTEVIKHIFDAAEAQILQERDTNALKSVI